MSPNCRLSNHPHRQPQQNRGTDRPMVKPMNLAIVTVSAVTDDPHNIGVEK